jgi:predicted metal-dependent HD superfamily phosphohydrolase
MLTQLFLQLTGRYTKDAALANNLWLEIFTMYSEPARHYHTVTHLEKLLKELNEVKTEIEDWDTMLFALYYHDAVYKSTSGTNEEDSAKLACKRLKEIGFPDEKIKRCSEMILATKSHNISLSPDTNYFTDADLSILGKSWQTYRDYIQQVREEYSIYPDFLYKPGRKKILQHFLEMETIFKTRHFITKYERQARINIANELEDLEA